MSSGVDDAQPQTSPSDSPCPNQSTALPVEEDVSTAPQLRVSALKRSAAAATDHQLSPDAVLENTLLSHSSNADSNGINSEPPLKRRKYGSLPALSRAVSPPWKKHTVEGPTSFTLNGKRVSARTNAVPLELQAPSSKRTTRAKHHRAGASVISRYGAGSKVDPPLSRSAEPRPAAKGLGRPRRSIGTSTQSVGREHTTKTVVRDSPRATDSSRRDSLARHHRHHRKTQAPSTRPLLPATEAVTPVDIQKRRPGRPRKQTQPLGLDQTVVKEELDRQYDGNDHSLQQNHDSLYQAPLSPDRRSKHPRLKFKVRIPQLEPQHPLNIARPKHFESFAEWVAQDDALAGTDDRMTRESMLREARSRENILEQARPGGLLAPGRCSAYLPEAIEEPDKGYAHYDRLLNHLTHFRGLLDKEHRRHVNSARKLALACQARWREIQPKTEEQLQQERRNAERARIEAIMQQCMRDLIGKWDLLRYEVDKWRLEKWQEEQETLEREALNKVLEQSTQLLDARRLRNPSLSGSEADDDDDDDEDTDTDDIDDSQDEQNMSSDDSSDDAAEQEAGDDAELTIEELRRKYEQQPYEDLDRPPDATASDSDKEHLELSVPTTAAPTGMQTPDDFEGLSRRLAELPELENAGNLGSDSDESTDMDSDMGDSDTSEDAETDNSPGSGSDAAEDAADGANGLLSFFSKQDIAKFTNESSDDELATEPKSSPHTNDHRTPEKPLTGRPDTIYDDDSPDELSLIPDAAQVQTPSASNSEEPPQRMTKEPDLPQGRSSSGLRQHTSLEELQPAKLELDTAMALDTPAADSERGTSLPVTPISSVKPLKTPVPSLLRGTLREYQHFGLDWLAGLYANGTNGILADEMGLGKTIQTISLLAHLAVHHEIWGPHLVVVPTSVMLNWEMEFKKFLPGFKILTYFGTADERKQKRKGWLDDDKWNVVITSYQLVLADQLSFKKREWHYLVLDEAHNIKNFRSQRWQTLLTFRSHSRLLLTGTPLQNNLTELWSLMFFLMPSDSSESGIAGFAGLQEFTSWFKKPVDQILEQGRDTMDDEARELVRRLHEVLRPYLLRRLKADVEKQMPGKYEHVVYCKLSKRQRYLYDGFMSRASTRETLARGNYLSIINCLMQLRKVCNHPDLFETRPIVTSFAMPKSAIADYEIKELLVRRRLLQIEDQCQVSLDVTNLIPAANGPISALDTIQPSRLGALVRIRQLADRQFPKVMPNMLYDGSSVQSTLAWTENRARCVAMEDLRHTSYLTSLRSQRRPLYSHSLTTQLRASAGVKKLPAAPEPLVRSRKLQWLEEVSPTMTELVMDLPRRSETLRSTIQKFSCVTPAVTAPGMTELLLSKPVINQIRQAAPKTQEDPFHEARMRLSIAFPDKRLLQYDCGKLQRLDALLRQLQAGGHRALIFTQMTKVLDLLEQFLNIHGHRYLRLDGSTKIEQRQILTDRFNHDDRILAFILSSRSGGLGINLTGADTVIFYDLDWNPAMDKQCQDRCHRIGQTRDVHIYRFVSEYTIEANILRKANQKRLLDDVVIQGGDFTTDFFHRPDSRGPLKADAMQETDAEASAAFDRVLGNGPGSGDGISSKILEQAEDREDVAAARVAEKEAVRADEADFADGAGAPADNGTIARSRPDPTSSAHESVTQSSVMPTVDATLEMGKARTGATTASATDLGLAPDYRVGAIVPRTDVSSDIFKDRDPIGVDRYMVEWLERELKDVPVGPALDKARHERKLARQQQHQQKRSKKKMSLAQGQSHGHGQSQTHNQARGHGTRETMRAEYRVKRRTL